MARGQAAPDGATRVAKNRYHYTKVKDRGWVLTHWLIMEEHLNREIASDESVRFVEPKYKRMLAETGTVDLDGLVLIKKRTSTLRKKKAQLEARIEEMQAELKEVNAQLHLE